MCEKVCVCACVWKRGALCGHFYDDNDNDDDFHVPGCPSLTDSDVKRKDSAAMVGLEKGVEALTQKRTIRRLIKLGMVCLLITMRRQWKQQEKKCLAKKAMRWEHFPHSPQNAAPKILHSFPRLRLFDVSFQVLLAEKEPLTTWFQKWREKHRKMK